MSTNITSQKLMFEIENVIQSHIDAAKGQDRKPTKNEIMELVTHRLEELIESSENEERIWIISGIAVGIAISLHLDDKLNMNE